jgi:hypothetical protein
MEGSPWTIRKAEVRCPCGTSFENADTYLLHKRLCINHQKETSIRFTSSGAGRRAPIAPAEAPTTAPSREPTVFCSSQSSKNPRKVRNQEHGVSARKQQRNTQLALSYSGLIKGWDSDAGSMSPAVEHPVSLAGSTGKIHCACGRTFAKQGALDMHLRDSKAHQAGRIHSAAGFISLTSSKVQPTILNAPPPPHPPASAPVPGTIPSSTFLVAQLLQCTCGHSFETQRILDLHKRDSLYHQRHADHSSAPQKHRNDSLPSALASMTLHSEPARTRPSAASLTCICGCIFSTQAAFDQHNADAVRYAWLIDREARN